MKFVCIGYINETQWESLTEVKQSQILEGYFNYYQELKMGNKFLGGTGLQSVKNSCKLSLVNGRIEVLTLEPNIEQIGGFFILEATNIDEAKSIVAAHPGLKVGSFEIRAVDDEITEMVGAI